MEEITLLCITHQARRPFHQNIMDEYDKQTYAARRIIILDEAAKTNWRLKRWAQARQGARYCLMRPGRTLGARRNAAMQMVTTPWFAWFDDDDRRSRHWLADLAAAWDGKSEVVTPAETWIQDLATGRQVVYKVPTISSVSAIFRTEPCAAVAMDDMNCHEEVAWLQRLAGRGRVQRLPGAWVVQQLHATNTGTTRERFFA